MPLRRLLPALALLAMVLPAVPRICADDVLDEAREMETRGLEAESRGRPDDAFDRYTEALQAVTQAMKRASAEQRPLFSMRGEIYLHRLYEFAQETERYAELDKLLSGLAPEAADPSLLNWIHWYRGHSSIRAGKVGQGDAQFKALGFLTDWLLCGPFANDNGTAGWSTEFGPETEPDLNATFDGVKRKVGWRAVPVTGHSGYIDLDSLFTPNDDAIVYALCYVRSPTSQPAALRIASDEGCRIRLNGVEVHANEAMRSATLDQDIVGVRLAEGWNRLLIRVSEADGPWGFRCRLTAPDGAPLRGLETLGRALLVRNAAGAFATPVPPTPHAASDETVEVSRGARDVLRTLLEVDSKNGYEQFHEAYLLATLGSEDKHKHVERDAAERALFHDENPHTLYLAACLSEVEAEMDAEKQEHRKRTALEKTLKADPAHALAMLDLAEYYLYSEQNIPKAIDLVDRALAVNPEFLAARMFRNEILDRKGFTIEAWLQRKALLDSARKTGVVLGIGAELAAQDHDLRSVVRLHLQALERDFANGSARSELIDGLLRLGECDAALQECRTTLALNPFSVDAHLRMARIHESRQRYGEAIACCRAALELAPENDDLLSALGTWQHLSGDRAGAIESWKEALTLNPNNVWLR
ncbi:MAG: tetratricopeptide repeat protein, partial [Planctomycetes bacterium]|nr:tetratricopeptide repeat protein [Planctomycetota bacterium]